MRPPYSAAPSLGHVISDHYKPSPFHNAAADWRNLTSDNSIQILNLDTDESFFNTETVANCLKYVDTFISPKSRWDAGVSVFNSMETRNGQEVTNQYKDEEFIKTVISLDSLSNTKGDMFDEKIIFSRGNGAVNNSSKYATRYGDFRIANNNEYFKAISDSHCIGEEQAVRTTDSGKQLGKAKDWNSESDLGTPVKEPLTIQRDFHSTGDINHNDGNVHDIAVNLAEVRNKRGLVRPIKANENRSKIGDFKRVSLRTNSNHLSRSANQHSDSTKSCDYRKMVINNFKEDQSKGHFQCNTEDVLTETAQKYRRVTPDSKSDDSMLRIPVLEEPKVKVAKLVKCGLKSALKTKQPEISAKTNSTPLAVSSIMSSPLRQSQRKCRNLTKMGRLSEFIRQNESRHILTSDILTPTSVTHAELREDPNTRLHADINSECHRLDAIKPQTICYPRLGLNKMLSVGRSDLKFNSCKKKLFQFCANSPNVGTEFDPIAYVDEYVGDATPEAANEQQALRRHRPCLGLNGKRLNVLAIDEIDKNTICGLKKRIIRENRSSRIKTNGSLKLKMNCSPTISQRVSSPRRKSLSLKNNLKREPRFSQEKVYLESTV